MSKNVWAGFDAIDYLKKCSLALGLEGVDFKKLIENATYESFSVNGKCALDKPFVSKGDHSKAWDPTLDKPEATRLGGKAFGIYMFYWAEGGFFLKIGQAGPNNEKRWGWEGKRIDGHYVIPINKSGSLPGSTLAKFLWSQKEPNPPFPFDGDKAKLDQLIKAMPSSKETDGWSRQDLIDSRKMTSGVLDKLSKHYGEWIEKNCERYDILFYLADLPNKDSPLGNGSALLREITDYFESALQLRLQPLFEQNCFNPAPLERRRKTKWVNYLGIRRTKIFKT
jgi:hypothetical protein